MSFEEQRNVAYARTMNMNWGRNQIGNQVSYVVGGRDTKGIDGYIRTTSFRQFAKDAYGAKKGYAIRVNPSTGEKEMYVRGTTFKRFGAEWGQNVLETLPGKLQPYSVMARQRHADYLSKIAIKEGVTVIYGHSRGAAVVSDMNVPGATKLGLDGAMSLKGARKMPNYRQKQLFDYGISRQRGDMVTKKWVPIWKYKRYHYVYG